MAVLILGSFFQCLWQAHPDWRKKISLAENETVYFPQDLNTATLPELNGIPHLGPVLAQRIWQYRQEHGAFLQLDDLQHVPGFSKKTLQKIQKYFYVKQTHYSPSPRRGRGFTGIFPQGE